MVFGREPALFLGMIAAILAVAMGFGLSITAEQLGLIMAGVISVVSFCVRQSVTPVTVSRASELLK